MYAILNKHTHVILVAPEVDLDASVKEKIVVHAGGTIRLLAHVSGKPAPEITWSRDDQPLPAEAKVEITSISSALVIKNCRRHHQGIYTLIAKNEGGERKKAVIVEVLGKKKLYLFLSLVMLSISQVISGAVCIKHLGVGELIQDQHAYSETLCEYRPRS